MEKQNLSKSWSCGIKVNPSVSVCRLSGLQTLIASPGKMPRWERPCSQRRRDGSSAAWGRLGSMQSILLDYIFAPNHTARYCKWLHGSFNAWLKLRSSNDNQITTSINKQDRWQLGIVKSEKQQLVQAITGGHAVKV